MKIAPAATTLISTVGTSLFFPNLHTLRADHPDPTLGQLATAYAQKDWPAVAALLSTLPPSDRICGAELNSLASLVDRHSVAPGANLFFCHSDTADGRAIASILQSVLKRSYPLVKLLPIEDLQDDDPRRFRTRGLRNLARAICQVVREYGTAHCAINATGGYKAQIAIAVMMGQAIHVPVYYKHEKFNEIIAFPPMPVSLDFSVWLAASGMLFDLESAPFDAPVPLSHWVEGWDERYESLVERVMIDGVEYLDLSPTGQIFHDTFRQRFRTDRDAILPPPAAAEKKRPPKWEASGHMRSHPEIQRTLQQLTDEVPQVLHCATFYFNPDLPARPSFRIGAKGIEGWLSNGTWMTKFRVETTANTPGQELAVVAALNEWLRK